jgi:hypothetical protein
VLDRRGGDASPPRPVERARRVELRAPCPRGATRAARCSFRRNVRAAPAERQRRLPHLLRGGSRDRATRRRRSTRRPERSDEPSDPVATSPATTTTTLPPCTTLRCAIDEARESAAWAGQAAGEHREEARSRARPGGPCAERGRKEGGEALPVGEATPRQGVEGGRQGVARPASPALRRVCRGASERDRDGDRAARRAVGGFEHARRREAIRRADDFA